MKWCYDGWVFCFAMPKDFEHHETTLIWEHDLGLAELYTTDRRLWLRAVARNPNFVLAEELKPGYRLVLGADLLRTPDMVIRTAPGGDEAVARYLTDAERAARAAASERLLRARSHLADPT
jgi:hypothetical protein